MPGKVKVRILAGRNLPVMDRASDTCDAFVELKLGNTTFKTEVFRHSLNPQWNSEWFRFEVDDEELQDEPLQIRVMDYDTYSANDAIGKVYIDLNPLLCKEAGSVMSGWFPIYDTMHGIRGEISVMVKVHHFSDSNKYRESSCGVQFFYSCSIPCGYKAQSILGFVEELVVNDDPEYQWIDKIRTPRASNEARQTLFSKLSGEVQRKIGLKALDLGGNAVIGYHQCFDLEGESGIVVRGIGTAVLLTKAVEASNQTSTPPKEGGREQSPPSVALHRTASSVSVTSVHSSGVQSSRLLPIPNISQARSRSPSPNPFGSSPGIRRKGCIPSASPKKISKAQSEVFPPLCEMECILCQETILQKEKANPCLHTPHQLKCVSAQSGHRSSHVTTRLKRIRSDPLYPRSPLLEDTLVSTTVGPSSPTGTMAPNKAAQSPAKSGVSCTPRRSSDSDLSTTPKGNSLGDSGGSGSGGTRSTMQRPTVAQESLSMLEYPFITMKQFPLGLIQHIGGVVSARSVKLLVQINNPDEPETRDAWWTELRKEMRSHIKALGCNVVLGYMETTNISDDICVLSASGTAAVLSTGEHDNCIGNTPTLGTGLQPRPSLVTTPAAIERRECEREKDKDVSRDKEKPLRIDINLANQMRQTNFTDWADDSSTLPACGVCHIPYSETSVPFPACLVRCNVCRKSKVPDVLFMTIEPPPNIPVSGRGCLLQARVCKGKKDGRGEQNAKEISDSLPFLEYELHRQLLNKLKVKGMNTIFGLKVQVSVGDKLIVGVATGTGAYVAALPPPSSPKITCGKSTNSSKMAEIQKLIQEAVLKNKEFYNIKPLTFDPVPENIFNGKSEEGDSSGGDEDLPDIDLSSGNKDACILEVDDAEDVDIISQLIDPKTPDGFEMCNTESLPGVDNFICNLQMFTRVFRTKLIASVSSGQVSQIFEEVIRSLFVKLRRLVPCCLADLSFQVDLVEQDEMQISVLGVAIGLGDPSLLTTVGQTSGKPKFRTNNESEMIFQMDEEKTDLSHYGGHKKLSFYNYNERKNFYHVSMGEHFGVEITPLSSVPGKRIERYLGDLDFFFIRETTSIREGGGLNGFIQSFVTEMLAIVRAHVAALGGNGVVSFHMTQCILLYNPHKNQGQCLINVAGDAVLVQLQLSQHADGELGKFAQADVE